VRAAAVFFDGKLDPFVVASHSLLRLAALSDVVFLIALFELTLADVLARLGND
jgi:hypothetical protein